MVRCVLVCSADVSSNQVTLLSVFGSEMTS